MINELLAALLRRSTRQMTNKSHAIKIKYWFKYRATQDKIGKQLKYRSRRRLITIHPSIEL